MAETPDEKVTPLRGATNPDSEETQPGVKSVADLAHGEIESLKKDLDKWKTDYLYLRADFDNFRKRVIKEREDMLKFDGERVLKALLDVQDNFERALSFPPTPENLNSFWAGVKMISEEIKNLMGRFGVQEIPSHKLPFDPNVNEALSSEPSNEMPAGHVTRVLRKAYKMNDRVIRPGQVLVAAEAPETGGASDAPAADSE